MIKLTQLLIERIDYLETAKSIVKKYKLKSKVKIGGAKHDYGDYIPEKDLILLKRSYPNVKEFVISVLHEIKHALDADRLGVKKFVKLLIKKASKHLITLLIKNRISIKFICSYYSAPKLSLNVYFIILNGTIFANIMLKF